MKKFLQKKLKSEKGMTLIELLAVIVIIAIIAAIAIPAISNIIENSRVGAAKSDAQNVLSAAQLYLSENSDALVGTGTITQTELEDGGYLDDLGGFEGTAAAGTTPASGGSITSITDNANGELLLNATAVIGGVTVVFSNASRDDIGATPNGTEGGTAGAFTGPDAGTIAVTRQ